MASPKRKNTDGTLILALACGTPVEAAAGKAGVSERTVYRRLADPEFRQRVHQTRADMVERAASLLTAAALQAVKTLLSLQETAVSAAVRLGAARTVLEMSIRLRELSDFEERLLALERDVRAQHPDVAARPHPQVPAEEPPPCQATTDA
jgi:hypothetical protein